ncbi:hypothetical protein WA026_006387 [Henosepilachna vigintioctopunctata]|uniref:CHK kinase-like domain-containing protein n=1 Tax=Henosepilachna vigintioctopunctata TaxID=420089 RepID=A0AAW1TNQ4_9CUCU
METLQNLLSPTFNEKDLLKIVTEYTSNLENIQISKVIMAPPSQKIGDSYLSQIVRFTVDASGINQQRKPESVSVNVIAKVVPQNLGRQKTFRSRDFFENEIIFYDEVWSSLKKFYESKNLKANFGDIIPNFLAYHLDEKYGYICLEDLSLRNYENVERGNGLNYEYSLKVIDLFAKFHSLSLAFKDQNPSEFTKIAKSLKETYFSAKYFNWYGNLQNCLFAVVRDAVKKELSDIYYDKIDYVFKDDFYRKVCDLCENSHGHLSVITEGDAWIPNFLFRNEGELQVALIDFQLARWAPITNDITFFMLTCVDESILEDKWYELIEHYVSSMQVYLHVLGSSPNLISTQQIQEEIKHNIYFTIAMSIEALTMSLVEGFDLDSIKGDDAVPLESVWVIPPFEDEVCRQRVANMIKLIVDKGYL